MDSRLQEISNSTTNTQIKVCMTKLWPFEVGTKIGDCSNVAMLRTNVAALQKQSIPTSRRCCTMSRCSRSVLGGFLAHFEPIMEGFKAQTRKRRRGGGEGSKKGTSSTLWDQGGGCELFLKI